MFARVLNTPLEVVLNFYILWDVHSYFHSQVWHFYCHSKDFRATESNTGQTRYNARSSSEKLFLIHCNSNLHLLLEYFYFSVITESGFSWKVSSENTLPYSKPNLLCLPFFEEEFNSIVTGILWLKKLIIF